MFDRSGRQGAVTQRKFQALESCRGVCALLVALYHLSANGHFYQFAAIRKGGFLGVAFFFVLSGFVMMHAYGRRITGLGSFRSFFLRRFGRLYPLHFAMLSILLGIEFLKLLMVDGLHISSGTPPFMGANSVPSLFANLFLLNGLGFLDDFTWNGPSWTISTEFWVYGIFFLLMVGTRRGHLSGAFVIAGLAGVALTLNALAGHPLKTVEGAGALSCIYGFFLGMICYEAFQSPIRKSLNPAVAEIVAAVLVVAVFAFPVPLVEIIAPIIFGFAIFCLAEEQGPVSKMLTTRVLNWMGAVSYSVYLVHFVLLSVMNGVLRVVQSKGHLEIYHAIPGIKDPMISIGGVWAMDGLAIIYVGTLLLLSNLTYRYIEVPWRDYFNRLAGRMPFQNTAHALG